MPVARKALELLVDQAKVAVLGISRRPTMFLDAGAPVGFLAIIWKRSANGSVCSGQHVGQSPQPADKSSRQEIFAVQGVEHLHQHIRCVY